MCSPSEGVKFADIPNGLAAISKAMTLVHEQQVCNSGSVHV